MNLYYHKTDGGAEYLTDTFIECPNGDKEGTFTGAKYIVRIDGNITKDAELTVAANNDPLEALERVLGWRETDLPEGGMGLVRAIEYIEEIAIAAIAKAKGGE